MFTLGVTVDGCHVCVKEFVIHVTSECNSCLIGWCLISVIGWLGKVVEKEVNQHLFSRIYSVSFYLGYKSIHTHTC